MAYRNNYNSAYWNQFADEMIGRHQRLKNKIKYAFSEAGGKDNFDIFNFIHQLQFRNVTDDELVSIVNDLIKVIGKDNPQLLTKNLIEHLFPNLEVKI